MRPPHAHRCRNLTGTYGPALEPGSPAWLATMSASKVASVVGLSPYTSRFTLWHEMNGTLPAPGPGPAGGPMERGTVLEPAIADWFARRHPRWKVIRTGTWTHPELPWATASPDRVVLVPGQGARLLEVKTSSSSDEWGRDGTDQIPAGYRAQVTWAMLVTGADACHVAALLPFLELREYQVAFDPVEATGLLDACTRFMDDLSDGVPPPLDGAMDTYVTLRRLHPEVEDRDQGVDPATAQAWLQHMRHAAATAEQESHYRNEIVAAMGTARRAVANGWVLGTRTSRGGNTPHFTPARTLPDPDQVLQPKEDTHAQ